MSFGGGSKWTPEYVRSLPTTGHRDLLYYRSDRSNPVRVGREVYQFYGGGDGGSWEKVFTIPDNFDTSTKTPDSPSSSPSPHESGGDGGGKDPNTGLGPWPTPNIYFPILETEYTAPAAQDWSQYMPVGGLLSGGAQARYPQAIFPPLDDKGKVLPAAPSDPISGGEQFDIPGLLYQPWSTEYQQAFVPGNIWQYDPNQFGVGEVKLIDNPYGGLTLPEDWEELLGPFDEPEEEEESSSANERK